ncbi:hypothetical protein PACTADRAFT_49599, partial [Pachysolen tannophilus NRRL Y-2460]
MKLSSLFIVSFLSCVVLSKRVLDKSKFELNQQQVEALHLNKRDPKRVFDLKLSEEDIAHMFETGNFRKRDAAPIIVGGRIINPNLKIKGGKKDDSHHGVQEQEQEHEYHHQEKEQSIFEYIKQKLGFLPKLSNIYIPSDADQLKVFEKNGKNGKNEKGEKGEKDKINQNIAEAPKTDTLANALLERKNAITIISSYARNNVAINDKLSSLDSQLIIFTPLDSAIASLTQKPWEFPIKITETNNQKDESTNANIENFLKSHIVDSKFEFEDLKNERKN